MARGRKTVKKLTLEERMEQALVPEREQPYSVPENWCWVKFGSLIKLISGRDAPLSQCNDRGVGIPYILGASNISDNTFTIERWIEMPQVVSKKNDILVSVKGTIGKLYIQQEDCINISRQIMAIRPFEEINTKLVYYFLQYICNELQEAGNGLIPGISRADLLEQAFALPPSNEQQRIIDCIEKLFDKLDEAEKKVQAVVDGGGVCRAEIFQINIIKKAILARAFRGALGTNNPNEESSLTLLKQRWEKFG